MVPLEQEQDIEVLRLSAILYRDTAAAFAKENARLKAGGQENSQGELIAKLQDQLVRLQKKFFGFGREEFSKKPRAVGHEQQALKLHNRRAHVEDQERGAEVKSGSEKREAMLCRIEHDFALGAFSVENKERGIEAENAGEPWNKIEGLAQESCEITIVERTYKKVIHRQAKYRLKEEYNKTGKEVIITAPGPAKLKVGCQYSIDFAIAVVIDKYESHLPLERQRRRMNAAGLEVDVKTLYGLCESVSEHCEASVIEKIRQDILADFCAAHLDESPWPLLRSHTKGQMWVLSNRIGSYYRFEPTRSGKVAEEMLEGYEGAALTDGFSGYNRIKALPNIRVGQCWAHARREFMERAAAFPKEASEMLEMIGELYEIEGKANAFEELRRLRSIESKAVIEKMHAWLWETKRNFLQQEGITAAIDYCLKFWRELTLFLIDLSVPLDNNSAERAERHAVMGRKNFGGSQTINGADCAATLYTVIESAKKVGLEPREYLKYVIEERWHKRDPKSPLEISLARFGKNTETVYPVKNEWRV